ncbi:hypothetical protein HY946_00985 [Candidatus Gottesmanbacteria bacterium]|nr:hypothetical protein [Candidatus Gottesmanbacteria bacterium]
MGKQFSRLARFEEKEAYRRLFLTILGTVVILLSLIFLGVPALVKFSLLISNLRTGGQTTSERDTTSPFSPRLEAPHTATNSAKITISGYAEPGTTLEIFLNGDSLKEILLGSDGLFIFPDVFLTEGENKITATAKDTAGNISQPTEPLIIVYKRTPPALEISQPQEGESFSGEKKEVPISGLTEPGVSLSINGRLVMVKNDGSFLYSLPLTPGENLIRIAATDIAGNQTIIERKITFSP